MAMQVNEAEEALAQLAAQVPPLQVPPLPKPPLKFAFTEIGEQIIASLIKAADDQVAEAQRLREDVLQLAESIKQELEGAHKRLEAMNLRTKEFGLSVVDAHRKFLNGGEYDNPTP